VSATVEIGLARCAPAVVGLPQQAYHAAASSGAVRPPAGLPCIHHFGDKGASRGHRHSYPGHRPRPCPYHA
jgi:hypothetical protein